jgi:uncharacterized protein
LCKYKDIKVEAMRRIGLISDTHNFLDERVFDHFKDCDEIWHAGDFGSIEIAAKLSAVKPLKGVYGNIDGYDVRSVYPETLRWKTEDVEVMMTHIGGYPPKYNPAVLKQLKENPPKLFISGHSHILKVIFDKDLDCLHMNPGAAGRHGWHTMRTILRFDIDGNVIRNCEVVELGKRS